jgi:hypothetical protein
MRIWVEGDLEGPESTKRILISLWPALQAPFKRRDLWLAIRKTHAIQQELCRFLCVFEKFHIMHRPE